MIRQAAVGRSFAVYMLDNMGVLDLLMERYLLGDII